MAEQVLCVLRQPVEGTGREVFFKVLLAARPVYGDLIVWNADFDTETAARVALYSTYVEVLLEGACSREALDARLVAGWATARPEGLG